VYFNLNTISAMARPFAFLLGDAPIEAYARAFGGGHFRKQYNAPLVIPPEDLPDVGFRWPKYIWSWPRIAYDLVTHSPRRGDAWLAGLKTQKLDPKKPPAELAREVFADADLLYLITQAVDPPAFEKASRERLLAGLGGLPTVEASFDLWRLAQLDGTEQFAGAWDEFMAKHGHHCRGELELANARWSETPDYVRGLLRGMGQTDPRENHRKLAAERERLTEECRRRLKNPIKRWVFMRSLRRAQKWAVFREQLKDLFIQRIAVLRQALLAFGRHRSMPDGDVFFLKVSELETMDSFDWRARIAERRREYEANQKLMPPPVVVGRVDSKLNDGQPLPADAKSLEGIPVSPGVVTGKARVILRTDDHEQVLPGEILIAPFTDPAWTPYFINAAGVVMDQGGILSHGSIIAREYGLPAVTNVHCATRVIRTGDRVQVDGNRGRVAVLSGL
jgi:phosphohistidine swiveling domain-containing protein